MLLSLGVSDMSKDQLESLCSFVQVKPSVNQISSTSCCAIPEDLKVGASATVKN
jgi:diketogulonate reductase-like aldo/keto reductase